MDKIDGIGNSQDSSRPQAGSPYVRESGQTRGSGGPGQCECKACKERRYQCSEGKMEYSSGRNSFDMVRRHEQDHLEEHKAIADQKGLKVGPQKIDINSARCDECGEDYSSGGLATTAFVKQVGGKEKTVTLADDGKVGKGIAARKLDDDEDGSLDFIG